MSLVLKSNGTRLTPGVELGCQETGVHLAGCTGKLTLIGGTGKFKAITGGGDFQMRSDVVEYVSQLQGDSVETAAIGVVEWPALTYQLP